MLRSRRILVAAGLGAALASSVLVGTATPATAAAAPAHVLMWSGSTAYTDVHGDTWLPATGFVRGANFTPPSATAVIENRRDMPLYSTGRYGMTGWSTPVVNGVYRVELRMMDTWFSQPGQRVFTVNAENQPALTGVDIAKNVKQNTATERTFVVKVSDGVLNLAFQATVSQPTVSSIRADLVPTDATGAAGPADKPGADNTGPDTGALRLITADPFVLTESMDHLDIRGRVVVGAPNITLSNSIVRGNNSTKAGSLIDANNPNYSHDGFRLVDSIIDPTYEHFEADGILGSEFTVLRSEITGTTDAVKVEGSNVSVRESWLHDTRYFYGTGGTSYPDTHNDGVQIEVGDNVVIRNNTITGNHNGAIQVVANYGPITNMKVLSNWFDDGGCSVNVGSKNREKYAMSGIVNQNVFWRHQSGPPENCAITLPTTLPNVTAANNVWVDPYEPVVVSNGGT